MNSYELHRRLDTSTCTLTRVLGAIPYISARKCKKSIASWNLVFLFSAFDFCWSMWCSIRPFTLSFKYLHSILRIHGDSLSIQQVCAWNFGILWSILFSEDRKWWAHKSKELMSFDGCWWSPRQHFGENSRVAGCLLKKTIQRCPKNYYLASPDHLRHAISMVGKREALQMQVEWSEMRLWVVQWVS